MANLLDSNQNRMIVGNKYEIYIPVAQGSCKVVGLVFDDDVGYTFTYAGSITLGATEYIASPDVTYNPAVIEGRGLTPDLIHVMIGEGAAHVLCPDFTAAKFVRPATGE